MKVDIQEIDYCKKKLNIEVPAEAIAKEVNSAYESLKNRVRIKGFRKGKVPRKILEKQYGEGVQQEILQKLIPRAYNDAVKEYNLKAFGQPAIEDIKIDDNSPLSFTAVLDVVPQIEVKDYKGLSLTKKIKKITDKHVDEELANMQDRYAEFESTEDTPVEETNYVLIDIESLDSSIPLNEKNENEVKNYPVLLGKGSIIEDIEKALIGMKKDEEKEVKATFPEDYGNKQMAGKEIPFRVKVNEIKKKKVKELNDEFAKEIAKCENLQDLKKKIKENFEFIEAAQAKMQVENDLKKQLEEGNSFDPPQPMIDEELRFLEMNAQKEYSQKGIEFDKESFKKDEAIQKAAKFNVKTDIILERIAALENISFTEEELNAEINVLARQNNMKFEEAKKNMIQNGAIDKLIAYIVRNKALTFIIENSKVEDIFIES